MSIVTLGGISINPSIQWANRYSSSSMAQKEMRTVGGRLILFQQALHEGIHIDLEASEETGWVAFSAVQSLIALADTGAVYPLQYRDYVGNVMFRYTDGPAIEMQPLRPSANQQPDDPCFGIIRLITL